METNLQTIFCPSLFEADSDKTRTWTKSKFQTRENSVSDYNLGTGSLFLLEHRFAHGIVREQTWKIFDTCVRPSLTLSKIMNSSCVNATNCQLSVNTSECNGEPHTGVLGSGLQTEFNGLPVVFSPINVNYNGKCFVYILDSLQD